MLKEPFQRRLGNAHDCRLLELGNPNASQFCGPSIFGDMGFRCWLSWQSAVAAAVICKWATGRQVHLYTYSDEIPHPGLCALAEATSAMGASLRIIGLSKRPGYLLIFSHSPTLKFLMLQDAVEYELSIGRIAPDDLMIFVDGHDVFLQRPLSELVAAYERRWPNSSPYLISGEKNCWPWPHSDPSHGEWDPGLVVKENSSWVVNRWLRLVPRDFCRVVAREGPYPYPNIGSSMGPVSLMLEVLRRNNRIVLDEDVNDQGAMWLVVLRHAVELNIEIDQNAEIFMNMLQYRKGDLEREPCGIRGQENGALKGDWFVPANDQDAFHDRRDRSPPQNMLTNTTPAILHFNGPAHEDNTWTNCYHAFAQEFRATGAGHTFFDVDHGMYVSTDHICDYGSFFHINDFHVHPLNEQLLMFLEDFYQLPVDPGLLAWRAKSGTVSDELRLGKEEDLHRQSPHLHEVLSRASRQR